MLASCILGVYPGRRVAPAAAGRLWGEEGPQLRFIPEADAKAGRTPAASTCTSELTLKLGGGGGG